MDSSFQSHCIIIIIIIIMIIIIIIKWLSNSFYYDFSIPNIIYFIFQFRMYNIRNGKCTLEDMCK